MAYDTLNDTIGSLPQETLPTSIDLTELATETGGALPKGWYQGEIIQGYQAKSYTFATEVSLSKAGYSFNFRVALALTVPGSDKPRNTFTSFNYRAIDFMPARLDAVKRFRALPKGEQIDKDIMRSSLALGQLGQLQKATNISINLTPDGRIITSAFVGAKPWVRLTVNEESGYNEVNGFSATKK
jgi:hypothetical protein